jgi:UDP-3-O-[3-hydroxymyristoyl] N-acetylglucosamine deacetylase / 3-hydroxyacyl-[acyl-carrier-protein] dehydratase
MPRRTIHEVVEINGVGLHTGATTRVCCRPGTAGRGVLFRRTDLEGQPEIAARVEEVEATERRTAIGHGGSTIHTVEHILAAVVAAEVDDLEIELDGPEPPILDGSFAPYLELLEGAGFVEQAGEPDVYEVTAPFTLTAGDASYVVAPHRGLRLTTIIEWDHPLIGRQSGSFDITATTFRTELARARTFGFTREVEMLRAQGLLKGASTASAVALSDTEVIDTTLRWPDEFLRHKAGDILGDLALVGGRVRAHVVATRPSHRGNVALARTLVRIGRRNGYAMDISRILGAMPHRFPMLLVDRILEVEDNRRIVGLKNVTINEPFFQGHFPDHPIMPGVLIIEAMAQVGGCLLLGNVADAKDKLVYFMSLDNVKFRRPVIPGDQLRFEVEMVQLRGRTCRMRGKAWVDGNLVAEAEMMARVVDR